MLSFSGIVFITICVVAILWLIITYNVLIVFRNRCTNSRSQIDVQLNLFAVAEGYPDLKANENFLKLHDELTEIEDKIRFARRFYNDTMMRFNTKREIFPNLIVSNLFSFREELYFNLDE